MDIMIGQNIKRLRRKRDLTQEQLAECLNISNAAVSKWERGETYPDIALLPVLARFFNVSLDELVGYDRLKIEAEIEDMEATYWQLRGQGKLADAKALVTAARQKYVEDYRIMSLYMYDAVGGQVANPDALLEKKTELTQLCDCILNGCTIEKIRLEAINMKAKLLHASGKTPEALELLRIFPSFGGTAGIKSEQLFAYDTEESREWVRKNLYSLAEGFAVKLVKRIWFGEPVTIHVFQEKIPYAETIGHYLTEIYENSLEPAFLIMAHKYWETLALRITAFQGETEDIMRIRHRELQSAQQIDALAEKDKILNGMVKDLYRGNRMLDWTIEFLETAPQRTFARMREDPAFADMVNSYKEKR